LWSAPTLRKDHPLFAQRIRQSVRKGGALSVINSAAELASADAWAMPVANALLAAPEAWAQSLADVAAAIAADKGVTAPAAGQVTDAAKAIAKSLQGGERKAILLGNAAAHHAKASSLLALANWIGEQTGATVGYLTEAANTVGAQLAGALPAGNGLNAGQMLDGQLKAVILLNNEPEFDSAAGARAKTSLNTAQMVVTLSPFKANMSFSDVLLPIAPFTETPGTFVNAEGRVQGFHAVVKPLGDARPAWKVLRVLANLLGLPGLISNRRRMCSSRSMAPMLRSFPQTSWATASRRASTCRWLLLRHLPWPASINSMGWSGVRRRCN
jgi:NADH-quinone oxidoreductase subunit G